MCTITISKVVYKGYGIGFCGDKTYFVLNALPGDILDVRVLYHKKNSIFCDINNIITPSPYRTQPRCHVSNSCGACDWVNVEYDKQIELKTQIYNEIFNRDDLTINSSPQIDFYRNKCFFPVQKRDGEIHIGMFGRQSHKVIEHQKCFLYPPVFKKILTIIKNWMINAKVEPYDEKTQKGQVRYIGLRCSADYKSIVVIIVTKNSKLQFSNLLVKSLLNVGVMSSSPAIITGIIQNVQPNPNNIILGDNDKILFGDPFYFDSISDIIYSIHYKAFYQINLKQTSIIYKAIYEQIDQNDTVIDAYSGIGSIGIYIAQTAQKVYCIEENQSAIEACKENIELNKIKNLIPIHAKVENALLEVIDNVNTIIFDPPRKGLDLSIIKILAQKKIKKIIYLSCDPSTQKRDITLLEKHGYKLMSLKGYDMFPHTWHIESLASLEL